MTCSRPRSPGVAELGVKLPQTGGGTDRALSQQRRPRRKGTCHPVGEEAGPAGGAHRGLTWLTGMLSRAAMSSTVSLPSEMIPTPLAMAFAVMG